MHIFLHSRHFNIMVYIYYNLLVSATLLRVGWRGGFYWLLSPSKTGTVGFPPIIVFFTRCISTPWMFDFSGASPVSNLKINLNFLILYWGSSSFFDFSKKFGGSACSWDSSQFFDVSGVLGGLSDVVRVSSLDFLSLEISAQAIEVSFCLICVGNLPNGYTRTGPLPRVNTRVNQSGLSLAKPGRAMTSATWNMANQGSTWQLLQRII